jgi:hypothetical protein
MSGAFSLTRSRIGLLITLLPAALAPTSAAGADAADSTQPMAEEPDGWAQLWRQLDGSGSWRVNYFSSSKRLDSDSQFLDASLQLQARPELTERLSGKVEVRLTQSARPDESLQGQLVEASITASFAHADLHLGKQIVAWGRADGINPTDNLTPRDYTVLLPFEDDQRLGTPAATLNLYLTPTHTLTVFATPFFEPTIVPLPSDGYEISDRTPATALENTETGLRFNKVGESLDWSVSYYRGFSLSPSVRLPPVVSGTPRMELTYDRITVVGADVARNYGRFGLRAEIGYFDTSDDLGRDPVVKNPQLYWIAGIDRTFYENLNINVQYFERRIRNYQDPAGVADPLLRSTAAVNATCNGQRDAVNQGITFRVSNQWLHNALEAEMFGVINLKRNDSFLRAAVSYALNDHWNVTVGGEYYRGDTDTQYGSLSRNNSVFAEARYGF